MLPTGKLNRQIKILTSTVTVSPVSGERSVSWSLEQTVWGYVEPLKVSQVDAAKQHLNLTDHRITIRYRPQMTCTKRLQVGTRIFLVEGVFDPEDAHENTVIYATELK